MLPSRRTVMTTGVAVSALALTRGQAASAEAGEHRQPSAHRSGTQVHLSSDKSGDHSVHLQQIIDDLTARGEPVCLAPGTFTVANIQLRPGTRLIGAHGQTLLFFGGGSSFITATNAKSVHIERLHFHGQRLGLDANRARGLLDFRNCPDISVTHCTLQNSLLHGLALSQSSGRIQDSRVEDVRNTGVFALDCDGLDVTGNKLRTCGDNGIQIWRSKPEPDYSRVANNRITDIAAQSGGTGQNGNAINVFRAGHVTVHNNVIARCAYSAVRGNAASNIQIVGNTCDTLGEVALYAEFAFEGAMIANNMITNAATGVAITNFNEGGRLATVTGNMIRHLNRREFEPVDKRGVGIAVEADSIVSNNVIEAAPTAGLVLGWGAYRRDIIAAQNLIRDARVGIIISAQPAAGSTLISENIISGHRAGAIRQANRDQLIGPDLLNEQPARPDIKLTHNASR